MATPSTKPSNSLNNAWIALGGNLGHVQEAFIKARKHLALSNQHSVLNSSKRYQTPAIGPAGQADYLNAVIKISTCLSPQQLLTELHRIEDAHGRIRKEHWGERTLDLDLLAYDDRITNSPTLTLPHPHIAARMFVLRPLCDIDANWQHPQLKQSAQALLNSLIKQGEAALPEGVTW